MVRGGNTRGRGNKRKFGGESHGFTKRQKSHWKEFGEVHPADERDVQTGRVRKVEDVEEPAPEPEVEESSSSESDEEPSAFHSLLATFSDRPLNKPQDDTDSEGSSDDEDGGESSSDEDPQNTSELLVEEDGIPSDDDEDEDDDDDEGQGSGSEGPESVGSEGQGSDEELNTEEKDEGEDYRGAEFIAATEEAEEEGELLLKESDPFTQHFECDLDEKLTNSLSKPEAWNKGQMEVPGVGKCVMTKPCSISPISVDAKEKDLTKLHVKKILADQVPAANKKYVNSDLREQDNLSKLQKSLFCVFNSYQDLYYSERNIANGEEIRLMYCLHALNHVLKTRSRVIAHSTKIKSKKDIVPDDYRDQGLTRPKILIVVPFRDSALKIVNMMSKLLMAEEQNFIVNKKRFQGEYSNEEDIRKGLKPEDYEAIFVGNIDDHFRIGLGIAKKSLKLYTKFYMADIIISSPLGLHTIIGVEGEKERDFDFLSSIEVMIFDQIDIFTMQNWTHILHLMNHMHLQPKESHGVDFSRVRMWSLDGWSKFYRQTLIFSDVVLPEINALFNKQCHNYGGKLQLLKPPSNGSICHIVAPLPQVFHRISVNSYTDVPDARFEYFKSKILPQYRDKTMTGTLLFIPSYCDFVRLRNYMKKEELKIQKLCEYTTHKSIRRARSFFFHGRTNFLLYTERVHFYRRFRIRGIRHLLFYDLPTYPHFYSEIANMIIDPKQRKNSPKNFTCEVLYSKYDAHKLSAIVGTDRAGHMLHSDKAVHMFMTGDS